MDYFFDLFFQTLTFDFKDQYGDLTGTSDERVYVESVAQYYMDGKSIVVPLNSQIKLRAYYKVSGLNGPNQIITVGASDSFFDVFYQTLTFNFKDQNGDLTGTSDERVIIKLVN